MAAIRVAGELVEGRRRRSEEHGVSVLGDARRQFDDAGHDLFSVAGDDLQDLHRGRVSCERLEQVPAVDADHDGRTGGRARPATSSTDPRPSGPPTIQTPRERLQRRLRGVRVGRLGVVHPGDAA
jgi:hypothetical protein